MNTWSTVFLGIIAFAALATAVVLIAAIVSVTMLVRRMQRLVDRLDQQLTPLFEQMNAIGREAQKAASLATAQVERVDQIFTDVGKRVEDVARLVQTVVAGPVSRGAAAASAFRAVMSVVRDARARRGRGRGDDEEALFI